MPAALTIRRDDLDALVKLAGIQFGDLADVGAGPESGALSVGRGDLADLVALAGPPLDRLAHEFANGPDPFDAMERLHAASDAVTTARGLLAAPIAGAPEQKP